MAKVNLQISPSGRKNIALLLGFILGTVTLTILFTPALANLHAPGIANIGHENTACKKCHQQANGSLRQQIQANLQYILGKRDKPVSIGHKPIGNKQCLKCHDRPKDRHPVFRFFEPRFTKARQLIKPQYCITCHQEHTGKRITSDTSYCKVCHKRLKLKKDWKLNDVMGATTWTYPDKHISYDDFFTMLEAIRQGFHQSYKTFLQEIKQMKNPPIIGTKWPIDGYFVPHVGAFIDRANELSAAQTLLQISNLSSEYKGKTTND